MKKTILILSIMILFFAGCRKDDVFKEGDVFVYGTPNVPEEPGESGGFITTKCILLENYRGVRCNNCPAADEIALNIQKQYGHSVVVLGGH